MKKSWVLLRMILFAVFALSTSVLAQSAPAKEQTSSQSDKKSAANSLPDVSNDTPARAQKDQTSKYSVENQQSFAAVKQGTPKRRPAVSHAKPDPSRQQGSGKTPAADNLRMETPRNALDSHPPNTTIPSQVSRQPLIHPNRPVLPPTVALNGQQFKDFRNPGARMAISGGSANSTRGTAVINGTDMKHKP
jgi:cytoskeletal protein RodZ